MKYCKYTKEDYDFMINNYNNMTSTEIAKKLNCSRSLVLKIWMDNGLKGKELSRRYYFDFDYFKNIDSPNKAYIIGLLASDGNLYKRKNHQGQTQIVLHKDDEQLLLDICKELKYYKPLVHINNYSTLTLNSDIMYNDLLNIGLYPNKTYTLNTKNIKIPKEYIFDYFRGYFDGDGSISINKPKSNINITPCCYCISICGFISNLKSMQDILSQYNINCQITEDKRKHKDFGSLRFGSNKDKYKFLTNIYKHKGIKMERKYNISKEFIMLFENKYNAVLNETNK